MLIWLDETKDSNPMELEEYADANHIQDEPAFNVGLD